MGFDIVYLPPIHPIGEREPQGPQQLRSGCRDPTRCRIAVGDRVDGTAGTTPSHPELGTIEDFDDFVAAARDRGLEVALDLALQLRPGPPVGDRSTRSGSPRCPDGSIAYAENPPKKYEDIYPLNFDNDPDGVVRRDAAGGAGSGSTTA